MPVDVMLHKTYALRSRDTFLSVSIGEGQFGTSDVLLDGREILRASGPIGRLLVGHGDDLADTTLVVRTIVNDVSAMTNRMSVTYRLAGGQRAETFIAKGKVTEANDSLVFEATFTLKPGRER